MAAQAELLASAAQPVALLARLDPTASTAMVEQLVMAEPEARVLQALMEQLVRLQAKLGHMAKRAATAAQEELLASAA